MSMTSMVVRLFTYTYCSSNPTCRNTKVSSPAAVNWKRPSTSVFTLIPVDAIVTVTPGNRSWLSESRTVPEMVKGCWEYTGNWISNTIASTRQLLKALASNTYLFILYQVSFYFICTFIVPHQVAY